MAFSDPIIPTDPFLSDFVFFLLMSARSVPEELVEDEEQEPVEAEMVKENDPASGSGSKVMEQLLMEEAKQERLLLKLREKATVEKTLAELELLQMQKRILRDQGETAKAASIKKKQRGLLLRLQDQRHRIESLRKMRKKVGTGCGILSGSFQDSFGRSNGILVFVLVSVCKDSSLKDRLHNDASNTSWETDSSASASAPGSGNTSAFHPPPPAADPS